MTSTLPPLPPMTWLELDTPAAGRWTWAHELRWPYPLGASGVGRWEPELDEWLGEVSPPPVRRSRGEERLLDAAAELLRHPDYCAYVIRAAGAPGAETPPAESYYAAVGRDDDAVLIVDEPGRVRLARVHPTLVASAVAAQLPRLQAAPVVRVELPTQTAALLESGFTRGTTPEKTLRSALASARVPAAIAERLFADPALIRATGLVGAVTYAAGGDEPGSSPLGASWTEMPDGGMMSQQVRAGQLVWEPLTAVAVSRALTVALSGLASVREGTR